MTLEELEKQYEGREEDEKWFYLQAVLGTQADADSAYDEDGKFNCIDWFDCSFCPAFNSKYCI